MEYMTKLRQCQDKQEWDNYILENCGHALQLWGWGDLKAAHNWKVDRLHLCDSDGNVTGAAQVLIRQLPWPLRSIAYVPRGPVVDDANREELLSELAEYAKRVHHSVALKVEPDSEEFAIPNGWKKSANRILPARTIILDLNKTEAELLDAMAKKTRQYIRKSASEDIAIKKITDRAGLEKCLAIYHDTSKRAKFNLHNDQYYYDVFEKLGEYSSIFAAYSGDRVIAFLWLAISSDVAFELYGGMDEVGQQLRANYALKWHAICKCKDWGLSRYDFGGLIDGGVTAFKLGWSDKETELAGTFDRPLSVFYGLWTSTLPIGKVIIRKLKSLSSHPKTKCTKTTP